MLQLLIETKTIAYGAKRNACILCFLKKLYKNYDDCSFQSNALCHIILIFIGCSQIHVFCFLYTFMLTGVCFSCLIYWKQHLRYYVYLYAMLTEKEVEAQNQNFINIITKGLKKKNLVGWFHLFCTLFFPFFLFVWICGVLLKEENTLLIAPEIQEKWKCLIEI